MEEKKRRGRALIIEDNHVARTLLRGLLRKHGFEVEGELTCVLQACETAKRLQPDLICLDILLPDGDGLELLRPLKADAPSARVIMVSGVSDAARVKEALGHGADDFVVKPYSEGKLVAALERLFPPRAAG